MLRKLSDALPPEVMASEIPTIFTTGLGPLFVQEAWSRLGCSADTNAAFALHQAITRDPDSPGLTHLARAVLGLTLLSRWGGTCSPADLQLYEGLRSIAKARHEDAAFWARYIGCVTAVLVTLFPLLSVDSDHLHRSLRFVRHYEIDFVAMLIQF